ncbi:MAG: heme exporter protein CcmB [Armatimonadota bacterium]|nr:heme exporter protein CcmB [bacterium]
MNTIQRPIADRHYIVQKVGLAFYARSAWGVLRKDLTCELRARHALSAVLLFAVTSTVAVSITANAWGGDAAVSSALLWLVIYFSAMSGLSRAFVHEEESCTSATLKLVARPNAVYLGKTIFIWLLLTAMETVTVPLFVLLMGCKVANWGALVGILLLGGLGLSLGAAMAAAMVARATVKGTLFAVICFPLLMPALVSAVHGSSMAIGGGSAASDLRLLAYYCATVFIASLILFRFIWED